MCIYFHVHCISEARLFFQPNDALSHVNDKTQYQSSDETNNNPYTIQNEDISDGHTDLIEDVYNFFKEI